MESSSSNNNNNNNTFELENQFILRMPAYKDGRLHPATAELVEMLKTGSNDLKNRLSIDVDTETRKGSVKFDNEIFKARLVDLPCIIESLKTLDKKTFYKSSDICQMLVCKANGDDDKLSSGSDVETVSSNALKNRSNNGNNTTTQELNKKYLWMHGITPPLKNVRKKRFRKVAKKKIIDYAEIEAEVKRLFKTDREAIKIEYDVIYIDEPQQHAGNDDDEPIVSKKSLMDIADESLSSYNLAKNKLHDDINTIDLNTDDSNDIMTHRKITSSKYAKTNSCDFLIGDISSSSDSDDGDESLIHLNKNNNKQMIKISKVEQQTFDLDADESTNLESPTNLTSNNKQSVINDINEDTTNTNLFEEQNSNMGLNDDSSSFSTSFDTNKTNIDKMNRLMDELDDIKIKRRKQEDEINQINNPVLKTRLMPLLNELIEEEKIKNSEIDILKKLMNE